MNTNLDILTVMDTHALVRPSSRTAAAFRYDAITTPWTNGPDWIRALWAKRPKTRIPSDDEYLRLAIVFAALRSRMLPAEFRGERKAAGRMMFNPDILWRHDESRILLVYSVGNARNHEKMKWVLGQSRLACHIFPEARAWIVGPDIETIRDGAVGLVNLSDASAFDPLWMGWENDQARVEPLQILPFQVKRLDFGPTSCDGSPA